MTDDADTAHAELRKQITEKLYTDHQARVDEVSYLLGTSEAVILQYRTERDRLRAVVDAARVYRRARDDESADARGEDDLMAEEDAREALYRALDQLDVSPDMGGPSVGDRATCRWCHQPIIFTSSSKLPVAEDAWAHEGPQLGDGPIRQQACEPDMQSMLAEPDSTEGAR